MINYLIWTIVIISVFLNHYFRFFMQQSNADIVLSSWPIIGGLRYGAFLTQKWLLVIVSLILFLFWLKRQKNILKKIKENIVPILIIATVVLVVHSFSFQRWFEFDDYRVIGHHYAVEGTKEKNQMGLSNSTSYAIGMVYLVVRWFGANFELYNSLGLLIYFLSGVIIFAFVLKLQKDKRVALFAALFFITSPTYWRQTLQMQEFIGDGFSTLLFALTNLQLLFGFYPGAVISAAATLEFGLSRTHFIGIALFLIALLIAPQNQKLEKNRIIALLAFPLVTLLYFPIFINAIPESVNRVDLFSNLKHLLRIFDSVFAVTIPHGIAFPLIWFFRWLFSIREHISYILGGSIIISLLAFSVVLFYKRKFLAAKLIFIGITTVVAAISLPTLSGIRIIQNLKDLTIQYDDIYPTAPTSYGVFSTFGMAFIVVGFGQLVKRGLFKRIMIALILFNALTILKSDLEWAKKYSTPQRAVNPQLATLIPEDGKVKVIYAQDILSRYADLFYQIYRIREPIYIQNDLQAFIDLIDKHKPDKENIYVFVMHTDTYKVSDLSEKVRSYAPSKLTPELLRETLRR